ncbi:transcriptional regulator FeaR [Pseudomonas sp. R5(2019)]|uniref:transcriptional regulator FeaR n=1 Tax=Pseudomonas sp. R5(2019) TaxID=2697566 RepID=UPI0014120337|nr:transcriptional regulator FeaR [Pseudomonas sp. R5(2019)]NBA94753.1 transcriptional regulator FeaR [Pseudomonas sp. R5(2019)]
MTTAPVQRVDRFDQWLDQVNQVCGNFSATTLGDSFEGAISEYRAGTIKLSVVDVAQARLYRAQDELARSDAAHYYAAFQLNGQACMEQAGHSIELLPGDVTLIDSTQPSNFVYTGQSRQLSLVLPRQLVEHSLRFAGVKCGQRIPASSSGALLARQLILESTRQPDFSVPESEATLEAIVSLLRPAISALEPEDAHDRLLRKAMRYIDEQLCGEELCPERLAREIGVSVRGLYRLFAKKGLVVAQYIKNRRLDFCAQSLRQSGAEQKLSALGYAWGFADSSHFSTAFKARFGVSPGEYRRRYHAS